MSTYVMSDIHGCHNEFKEMLKKIEFSDYDDLYIIGDVCDRGEDPIGVLLTIMSHKNMHLIMGNHDHWFKQYIPLLIRAKEDQSLLNYHLLNNDCITWLHYNGGFTTADQFLDLEYPLCYDIENYLDQCPYYQELSILGKKYLLVHAGLGSYSRQGVRISTIPIHELIWSKIELNDNPLVDTTMIVGHTPTVLYGKQYEGIIAHGKNDRILHIDCGCVFGKTLGCLRLDDMKEFYVQKENVSA